MKNINPKLNIQSLQNWINFVKSVSDYYYYFIGLALKVFQQAFSNICIDASRHNFFKLKYRNFIYFILSRLEHLKVLVLRSTQVQILNVIKLKSSYLEINTNLIKKKINLTENITIFMFYCKNVNFVFFLKPIIHFNNI